MSELTSLAISVALLGGLCTWLTLSVGGASDLGRVCRLGVLFSFGRRRGSTTYNHRLQLFWGSDCMADCRSDRDGTCR